MPPDGHADVTVAIATLHRPAALARCVTAILQSAPLPAELVIVDQSTHEATATLVASSGWDLLVPVRYIRHTRRGLAAARNAAIAHASSSIVAFTDDDCVPAGGWLAAMLTAFDGCDKPDAVTGPILPLGPERPGLYAVSTRSGRERRLYYGRRLPWDVGSGGNAAIRREHLQRIGDFDERLGAGSPGRSAEDLDLFYRLLRAGAVVLYEPRALVYHERADAARRLATRPSYGFGLGTFCALWTRRRDFYAIWILIRWCSDRAYQLLKSGARFRWRRVREELLMLQGAAAGLAYGRSLDSRGVR